MMQQWKKSAAKIDAMSLRERCMVFAAVAVLLLGAANTLLLQPMYVRQQALSTKVVQSLNQIGGMEKEIAAMAGKTSEDPDAAAKARQNALRKELDLVRGELDQLQKSLVAPDKIAGLLEGLLQRNGKLRLVSLKSLDSTLAPGTEVGGAKEAKVQKSAAASPGASASGLMAAPPASATAAALTATVASAALPATSANAATPAAPRAGAAPQGQMVPKVGMVYRHGVELVLTGTYLDMLDYLAALEAMPWKLYWGEVRFSVEEYPNARLTLTLHTLSLDPKWMNL